MEALERERLARVPDAPENKSHGLIIPVAFRGANRLPSEIRARRQYENFDAFALGERRLNKHPKFKARIKVIAEYIAEQYAILSSIDADFCQTCNTFRLPTDGEIGDWLRAVVPTSQGFPGREEAR